MKLKHEIVGALVFILITVVFGQSILFNGVRTNQSHLVESYEQSQKTLIKAYDLHSSYRHHIESWKNILLRGHLPNQYHFYLEQFYEHDREFNKQLRMLSKMFNNDSTVGSLLNDISIVRKGVAKGYRATLDAYAQASETPQNLSIKYVEEELTLDALLITLTKTISEHQLNNILASNQQSSDALSSNWYLTLAIGILGTLMLYLLVSLRVVSPIENAVKLANKIKMGDTDRRLKVEGSQDFVIFTSAFNEMLNSLDQQTIKLELAATQMAESEKLAALGGLVAGVAHELNTPIGVGLTASTSIHDTVRHLLKKMESERILKSEIIELLSNMDEFCNLLERNIYRASELIHNFKQVAVDQTSERKRVFNIKSYIDEVLTTIKPKFKNTPFQIETKIENLNLNSYPGPIGQVLTNLIENSLNHGFQNAISGNISIEANATVDNKLFIIYRDNGCGMSQDVIDRIFDPFFTTAVDRMGSGLGMNIVYNIVNRLLGGTITVDSEQDRYTQFSIVFPIESPEKPETEIHSDQIATK